MITLLSSIGIRAVVDTSDNIYAHARDIAKHIGYSEKSISSWQGDLAEVGLSMTREEDINIKDRIGEIRGGTQSQTNYLSIPALKIVLLSVHKPTAKELLRRMMANGCEVVEASVRHARKDSVLLLTNALSESVPVICRALDGYINATALCHAAGKELKHWKENISTVRFLRALSSKVGIPEDALIVSKRGGRKEHMGTWVHPQVAIHIAYWASEEFAVQVTSWILELLTCGDVALGSERPTKEVMDRYTEKISHLETSLAERDEKLVAVQTAMEETRSKFDALTLDMVQLKQAHNALLRRRQYEKLPSGGCLYLIKNTREPEGIYKFGITKDINDRLKTHRTMAPCTIIKYLIYTPENKLLEDNIKYRFRDQINPAGSETITADVETIISFIRNSLNLIGAPHEEANAAMVSAYNALVPFDI